MTENKIVDLDRLKDYANKESVLLGKKVKDQVIFDGTASGFVADGGYPWKKGKLSGPLPIIDGEHYKVTIDGTVRADEECGEYDQGESCFYMADIGLAITSGGHVMDFTKARTTVNIKVEGTKRQLGTIDTLPNCNIVNGEGNFAVKTNNTFNEATGTFSVALGAGNIAAAFGAVAEGIANDATGEYAHAEGYYNEASGNFSHAEGSETEATGEYTHAEGFRTAATFGCAHAEGFGSNASGESAHAEGNMTTASGACAHSEGAFTIASGDDSHAQGYLTTAASRLQSVRGAANVPDPDEKFADIIGMGDFDGTTVNHARNIEATTYDGNKFMLGDVYVGANEDSTGGQKLLRPSEMGTPAYDATKTYQINQVVYEPNTDKFYKCTTEITSAAGDFDSTKWTEIKFGEGYLTKHNPEGTGALSMNRKSGTTIGANSTTLGENNTASGACSIAGGYGGSAVASGIGSICLAMESSTNDNLSTIIGGAANIIDKKGKGSESNTIIGTEESKIQGKTFQSTIIGGTHHTIEYADETTNCSGGIILGGGANKVSAPFAATIGGCYLDAADVAQTAIGCGNVPTQGAILVLGNGSRNGAGALVERRNAEITTVTGDKKMHGEIYVHCDYDSTGGVNICDTVKVTKAELNQLITDKKLIPGLLYQITDYTFTPPSTAAYISSANKQFDILLPALAKDKVAANGYATLHGTATEFKDVNNIARDLTAWKVEYDVANSKITYLTDEFDCGAPYDHINLMYKRFKTTDNLYPGYSTIAERQFTGNFGYNTYAWFGKADNNGKAYATGIAVTLDSATSINANTFGTNCTVIHIEKGMLYNGDDATKNITFGNDCHDIHIAGMSYNMAIGSHVTGLRIGDGCYSIAISDTCSNISIDDFTTLVAIRDNCKYLTIGKSGSSLQIGPAVQNVDFGNGCAGMEIIGDIVTAAPAPPFYVDRRGYGEPATSPCKLSFAGQNRDIFLKYVVRNNTFNMHASGIWMDTSKTAGGKDKWLSGFTFDTNCCGPMFDAGEPSAPLNLNDGGFESNVDYGTKRVYFSKFTGTTTGLPVVSWHEGITLKGKYKNASDQSSAGNWTAL